MLTGTSAQPSVGFCLLSMVLLSASLNWVDAGTVTKPNRGRHIINANTLKWEKPKSGWEQYGQYVAAKQRSQPARKVAPASAGAAAAAYQPDLTDVRINMTTGSVAAVVDGSVLVTLAPEGVVQSRIAMEACRRLVAGQPVVVRDGSATGEVTLQEGCKLALQTGRASHIVAALDVGSQQYEVDCSNSVCAVFSVDIQPVDVSEGARRRMLAYTTSALKPHGRQLLRGRGFAIWLDVFVSLVGLIHQSVQAGGCFPDDAVVKTEQGPVMMDRLRVGDRVLSINSRGRMSFDEVVFFGHKDTAAMAPMVALTMRTANTTRTLRLTSRHYLPVVTATGFRHMYAGQVSPGDKLVMAQDSQTIVGEVVHKDVKIARGLFNPYTKSGYIVVDGVLASAHSEFLLDDFTPESMRHMLPHIYQALFKPMTLLYNTLGPKAVEGLTDTVVPWVHSNYTALQAMLAGCTAMLVAMACSRGVSFTPHPKIKAA